MLLYLSMFLFLCLSIITFFTTNSHYVFLSTLFICADCWGHLWKGLLRIRYSLKTSVLCLCLLSLCFSICYLCGLFNSLNVCFVLSIASSSFPRQCLHKLEHWRSPYENDAIESSYVWKNKNCNCLHFSICVSISIFVAAFVCVSVSVSVSLSVSFFLLSSLSDCPQLSIASRHVSE